MIHLICPNPAIDRTLLIKDFKSGVPNRPHEVKEFAGGKGFNVAYAIGFEEPDADFCVHTIIGGRNGDFLKDLADERHIPLRLTHIDVNTRLCNIIIDTETLLNYPIYENSFNLDKTLLNQFTQELESSISAGDYVVFSGSLMKGMPSDYISNFIDKFKDSDVKFLVDTSGEALVNAYQVKPYAIKINDEEVLDLVPNKSFDTIEAYAELLESDFTKDIPFFIITLGSKGIIAKVNDGIFHIQAEKVNAKNPIASGDFFLGALVKNISVGEDPLTTLKRAISYSTANVLNWYPELHASDIEEIYKKLTIKRYK
nr:PfkB family carbohydrate kinase [uncultured Trichococcus sp.]